MKTWRALRAAGETGGRHRVARLRQAHGIEAKRLRRFRAARAARQSDFAPNLIAQDFRAPAPDRVWVGDMTFIATREGWLHLAVLLDLYSRRIVGWAMGEQANRSLVIGALTMAIANRAPRPGLIHHTDQGMLYLASAYRAILAEHGMLQSMSRKGDCYDNAVAESFFSNLKNELTWHRMVETRKVSPIRYEERAVP